MVKRGLYNVCQIVLLLLYLPKYLWGRFVLKKYKRSFLYRLCIKKTSIPQLNPPVIWIHAVSLGEAKAVIAFVQEAQKNYPHASIVVSSITETGFDEVAKSMPFITTHFFLPFDFSWMIRPLVATIKPHLVVFVEGDLWPNFLEAVKEYGAQTLLINGKISERSLKRYLLFKNYAYDVFSKLDHCCLQNTCYQQCFQRLNVPMQKLSITGNIKFDIPRPKLSPQELITFKTSLGLSAQCRIITIGSTHPGEEELLLKVLKPLLEQDPDLKILLAPRHPERFRQVEQLLAQHVPYATWSSSARSKIDAKVILIDTLGMLMECYQIAVLAIVGGSFVDIGGHNLLEPAEYGVAVLFGPYIYKQREFAHLALQEGIGFQVSLEALSQKVTEILYNTSLKTTIASKAKTLLERSKGASLKSWVQAQQLLALDKKVAREGS